MFIAVLKRQQYYRYRFDYNEREFNFRPEVTTIKFTTAPPAPRQLMRPAFVVGRKIIRAIIVIIVRIKYYLIKNVPIPIYNTGLIL